MPHAWAATPAQGAVLNQSPASRTSQEDVLYSAIISLGLHDEAAQRAVSARLVREPEVALRAVARAVHHRGLLARVLPTPAGKKTDELVAIVKEAALRLAQEYHRLGGVLTAKGFFSFVELAGRVEATYWSQFAAPVPTALRLTEPAVEEELRMRRSIAAQEVRDFIYEFTEQPATATEFVIPADKLESFCVSAVRRGVEAYLDPNSNIHQRFHGTKG